MTSSDRDYGLIIAAIVAIVAIVGLVILFSDKESTSGLQFAETNLDNICYFDPELGGIYCPFQVEKVHQIWNRDDAGQVPFVPGQSLGTFGASGQFERYGFTCGWTTEGCPEPQTACQVCFYNEE